MTAIKGIIEWIDEEIKKIKHEQAEYNFESANWLLYERRIDVLIIVKSKLKELCKKDLKRIKKIETEFDEFVIVDDLEEDLEEVTKGDDKDGNKM